MEIANEILIQLGGNKFIAMTGVKNLGAGKNYLQMTLSKNTSKAKYLTITLNSSDLYDLNFFSMDRNLNIKPVKEFNNIHTDQLQNIFTEVTGLYTSLK